MCNWVSHAKNSQANLLWKMLQENWLKRYTRTKTLDSSTLRTMTVKKKNLQLQLHCWILATHGLDSSIKLAKYSQTAKFSTHWSQCSFHSEEQNINQLKTEDSCFPLHFIISCEKLYIKKRTQVPGEFTEESLKEHLKFYNGLKIKKHVTIQKE